MALNMWKNLKPAATFLRGMLGVNAPSYYGGRTRSSFTSSFSTTAQHYQEQQQKDPSTIEKSSSSKNSQKQQAPLQLVTVYAGFSKEVYNTNTKYTNPHATKQVPIFGDDSVFTAQSGANTTTTTIEDNEENESKESEQGNAQSSGIIDVMGCADGVGGWREMGIDPSKFSSVLMQQCKRLVEQDLATTGSSNHKEITSQTPRDILTGAYNSLLESKDPGLIGSSTACIVVFNRASKQMYSANLGDSGYAVIRNNQIVHRSQEQHHYFNAPFQMAILPHEQEAESCFNDSPKSAACAEFELAEGDFIVMATDGLWDNLSESALLLHISNIKSYTLHDLSNAAKAISAYAVSLAKDPNYASPFSIAAAKYGLRFEGGKPDDITVLLARVSRNNTCNASTTSAPTTTPTTSNTSSNNAYDNDNDIIINTTTSASKLNAKSEKTK